MGFEPVDTGMSGLSLEDLAADTPLPPAIVPAGFSDTGKGYVIPTAQMEHPYQWYLKNNYWYIGAAVVGGVIGYFVFGMTGALIGSVVAYLGSQYLAGWVAAKVWSSVLHTG
jgi:hypothetical protein